MSRQHPASRNYTATSVGQGSKVRRWIVASSGHDRALVTELGIAQAPDVSSPRRR